MARFVANRLGSLLGIVLILAAVMFILQQVSPVDPIRARVGANATAEIVERERERLGYNDSLPVQYTRYVGGLATGDLGQSLRTRQPVREDLASPIIASVELGVAALVLAGILGVAMGSMAAARARGSTSFRLVLLAGASVPAFLVAMVGLVVFYRWLDWLPATGRSGIRGFEGPTGFILIDGLLVGRLDVVLDGLAHLVLPALCLALTPAAAVARVLRSSLVSTLEQDFVRTAHAKGLARWRVLASHALRNSCGPALSMAGLQIGLLLASLVIIEQIFAWPGVGLYLAQSIPASDFPAIAGVTLLMGLVYVVANAVVDLLQVRADPRILLK